MDDSTPSAVEDTAATEASPASRPVVLLAFLLEFGPFAIAAILLVLTSLASSVPQIEKKAFPNSRVGIYVCLALIALLGFLLRLMRQQSDVRSSMDGVVAETREALEHVRPDVESLSLNDAFQRDGMRGSWSDRVRIFAITTRFVTQQLRADDFKAGRVDLMVAGNDAKDPRVPSPEMLAFEVKLAIEYNWASRVRNGHIHALCVHHYEFFPTEWYVIFDERLMILGTYAFDERAVGCAEPLNTVMLVHASGAGRSLIRAKVEAFDRLMTASSKRVGDGAFRGEYQLIEEKVARRVDSSEWTPLPSISQTTPV